LEVSPSFFIGTAVNPTATDWPAELDKLEKKVAAGARFLQTQPLYEAETAHLFLERIAHLPVFPIIGILPLRGYKMAQYLSEKVAGVTVPPALLRAVEKGGREAGFAAAEQLVRELASFAPGIHIMPLNDMETALTLAKAAKES
jgi:5,10-methylenetetrahydrofolate reductase